MNRVIPVFKTGTHTDSAGNEHTFTAEMLRAIADKFNPDTGACPIVKGHPKTDDPAYGWGERFMFEESSGILYAVPTNVEPAFAAEVKARRYQKVSMAFFPPDHPNNPIPGMHYPRHIGFLGAASPAIPGLKAANFSDNGEEILMFDINKEADASKFSETIATAFASALTKLGFKAPDDSEPGKTPDVKDSPEFQALEAEKAELETKLKDQGEENQKLADERARGECAQFCEQLVTDGKLTPVEAGGLTEVLFALADKDDEVEFTVGEGKEAETTKGTPADLLKTVLKALPKRIEYSEIAGQDKDGITSIGFTAPADMPVMGGERMDIHRRATAYAAKHNIGYLDAVSVITGGTH